jgi:para-nitrobenzyl esterase
MLRIAKTENGLVRGIPAVDPRITVFKGVPFAAPPVGKLRWRAPQPAANWKGVRDCLEFKPIAVQKIPGEDPQAFYSKEWHVDPEVAMNEDCLYLNIWTSAKNGQEKMPVMVWIFGGGLREGYPYEMEFDGERIAHRGVILVSLNYRLNVFGFLTHPEIIKTSPDGFVANWGFLDQKAAIDWVGRNIANFGGDPQNITIFGQSAGGGSVYAHLNAPLAKGSFAKAIMQSGGGFHPKEPVQPIFKGFSDLDLKGVAEQGQEFFSIIGVKSLAEAKEIDFRTIMAKHLQFDRYWPTPIDGKYLVEDNTASVLAGHQHQLPIMIGSTSGEFLVTPPDDNIEVWAKENIPGIAKEFCRMAREKAVKEGVSLRQAAAINTVEIGASLFCEAIAKQGKQTVFNYSFSPEIPGDNAGVFHSSDLWFEFETLSRCWRPFKGKHFDLARQMCNYWTNFAKNGDPNGLDADGTPMPKWAPYTLKSPLAMEFRDIPGMEKKPNKMRKLFVEYNSDGSAK